MTTRRYLVTSLSLVTLIVTAASAGQRSGSTIPTERIFESLHLHEGQTVCEMGAGDGELTIAAAGVVAPDGRVYSSELGQERLKSLRTRVEASGLPHITVVEGAQAGTNFPDAACDAVFMRNVYHHFTDPAAINASIRAALKPGGRLAVVDFSPPGKEAATPAGRSDDGTHGITSETLSRELSDAGFEPLTSEAGSQRWFIVVVANPTR